MDVKRKFPRFWQPIIDQAKQDPKNAPQVGIRVKLYSRGSGKWAKSSGESSKFGLTTIEVLQCLNMLGKQGDVVTKLDLTRLVNDEHLNWYDLRKYR